MSQVWDDIDQRYVEVDDEPQDWTPDGGTTGVHFPTQTTDGITYTANPYDPPVTGPAGPAPTPTPGPGPGPGPTPTPGGFGGFGGGNSGAGFQWPGFKPPPLPTLPTFQKPADFSFGEFAYDPFTAPTMDQAMAEPGYEMSRREGQRALENSAGARGVLRTGGTLKDLIGFGQNLAAQQYGNVYNRAANTYGMNRTGAFDTWKGNRESAADTYRTNFGVSRDVFDRQYGRGLDLYDRSFNAELAKFNPQFTAAQLTFGDIYNRDRDRLNSLTNIATAGAGA